MVSFKQFLLENEQDPIDLIKRDCKPFLSIWEGNPLVRGLRISVRHKEVSKLKNPNRDNRYYNLYRVEARKDRTPVDMELDTHTRLNSWFKDQFGVNARAEAIFCYSKQKAKRTAAYGMAYAIFPIGKFKIIWAPFVTDLMSSVDYGEKKKNIQSGNATEVMKDFKYTDDKPLEGLKSASELMVICDEYYAIDYDALELIENEL